MHTHVMPLIIQISTLSIQVILKGNEYPLLKAISYNTDFRICMDNFFMCGDVDIMMPHRIKHEIKIVHEDCNIIDAKTKEQFDGILLVDVLCDQTENLPFLQYKVFSFLYNHDNEDCFKFKFLSDYWNG